MVKEPNIDVEPAHYRILKRLFRRYVPGAKICVFGSRVKGTARQVSDLDIVIISDQEKKVAVENLREALEESDLPFRVDIHVWSDLPEEYRDNINQQPSVEIM